MTKATTITAYNKDIQRYIERPRKTNKTAIIAEVKAQALANGINFNRLFPRGTKRYYTFDTIVYLLSTGGICTITSDKLAEKVGASVRTVYDAVKAIKELDLFIVGGLADGNNKYVFVYKNHADYAEILANVFYVNPCDIDSVNVERIAEPENVKDVDTKEVDGDETDSIIYIYKQEKDNNYKTIKKTIENEINKSDNHDEKASEYLTNSLQRLLYTMIKDDKHIHATIKDKALIIALRAGSNIDKAMYNKAMVAVRRIDKHITLGGNITTSIPALFERIYSDRVKYSEYYKRKQQRHKPAVKRDTSVYFDWLNV